MATNRWKENVWQAFWMLMFLAYMVLLCYLLFFAEGMGRTSTNEEYHYNLVLFHEIRRFIEYRHVLGWNALLLNVFGNIAAFVPFGFLVPLITKKSVNGFLVVLYSFELSLLVEVIQLLFKIGSFDVDDIVLNTCGGLLGYIIFFIGEKIFSRRKKR